MIGAVDGIPEAPPDDTGEALGLPPSGAHAHRRLRTVAVPRRRPARTASASPASRPAGAGRPAALPRRRAATPAISGGDLCVQACANDPQVAVHAIRNLARIGFGVVSVRWSQLGFGRTSSTSHGAGHRRATCSGFKDGTAQPQGRGDRPAARAPLGRSPATDRPGWPAASYLVTRKIRMIIETWDRTSLGRAGDDRRPGQGRRRAARPDRRVRRARLRRDRRRRRAGDRPTVAHVRLAHPDHNDGARLLRRGYNFVDGSDGLGRLNAGLFFIAYQRDPRTAVRAGAAPAGPART